MPTKLMPFSDGAWRKSSIDVILSLSNFSWIYWYEFLNWIHPIFYQDDSRLGLERYGIIESPTFLFVLMVDHTKILFIILMTNQCKFLYTSFAWEIHNLTERWTLIVRNMFWRIQTGYYKWLSYTVLFDFWSFCFGLADRVYLPLVSSSLCRFLSPIHLNL